MAKNRRATAVNFGFDFQANAAIMLMLDNITSLSSLRLEGDYEDIELKLNDGEYIFAQAKAIEKSSTDFHNVRSNLEKALLTLSEAACKASTKQLILITNSPNPLNENASRSIFYGSARRTFSTLPDSSQKLISDLANKINQPLDLDKFMIQVVPFETDDERERYKVVKQAVDDFIGDLKLNIPGMGNELLYIWQNDIFHNATKKDSSILLTKKDLIWPIIVIATDIERLGELPDIVDGALYDEVLRKYKDLINTWTEQCELYIKVLHNYSSFVFDRNRYKDKAIAFVSEEYMDYLPEFKVEDEDEEIQVALVKIVLYAVLNGRFSIEKIKRGTNLC